ncbi:MULTISPECIES: cation diffusion facilitator family transporter [unclassified Sphingomonas]|uniref:cation diffusion facilitator family transporter n=1 Tax=unclassified Sphingomonas TaxID=196159 RepID=UPI000E10B033|nr:MULTISPECIES: cation diffusion facilitator family transporter [unclassified Sphingomonas]AXJ95773.1 cation transporter [Sphingomonas sp. FARSPH]
MHLHHDHHDHGHDHHGHGHAHGHGHGGHGHHGHSHAPASFDRAFAIGIGLNIAYVLAESGAGLWTGSVALLADAGHNLSDVLGLAVAWAGATLAKRGPTKRFTYGLKGSTILAALLNALLLLVALGAIALEAVQRIGDPPPLAGLTVSAVAGVGILVNAFTAWLFASGRKGDVNVRAAYLHMLSDAAVSAAVVVAGMVIWATGIGWIDPVISLVIAGLIFWQTWGLLRETVEMSLAAVPRGIDYDAVEQALAALPGVAAIHDLHIWPMSTTEPVLTAHLLMPGGLPGDAFLGAAQAMLHDRFGIGHATLQVETGQVDLHGECGGC